MCCVLVVVVQCTDLITRRGTKLIYILQSKHLCTVKLNNGIISHSHLRTGYLSQRAGPHPRQNLPICPTPCSLASTPQVPITKLLRGPGQFETYRLHPNKLKHTTTTIPMQVCNFAMTRVRSPRVDTHGTKWLSNEEFLARLASAE